MAPRRKRQEAGRTAKTGGTEKSGGTQKRTREQQNRCVWRGVLWLPDLCLLKKKTAKNDVGEKTKGKENDPEETPDLTTREFFPDSFGSEPPKWSKNNSKNPPKKHKTNTTTQKQKFAPENFSKQRPLERRNDKKRQKTPNRTEKNTKRKKRTAFPPWGNTHSSPTVCDSNGCLVQSSPTPFLGCPLQRSAGRGWGECDPLSDSDEPRTRVRTQPQKTMVVMMGAPDDSLAAPVL